jgi:nitrogen fixation protein FixH
MRAKLRRLFRITEENPLTGWHALALVVAFFAIIILVSVVMTTVATSTSPGVPPASAR